MPEQAKEPRAKPNKIKITRAFWEDLARKPPPKRVTYWDEDLDAFGLRVESTGHRSYLLRYWYEGKQPQMTIDGRLAPEAARKQARVILGQVAQGHNPLGEQRREKAKATSTLKAVCEDYLKREGGMTRDADGKATFNSKLKSAPQRLAVFERHVYPDKIAKRQIEEIKRSEIVKLLDKIEDGPGPQAAHQVLAFLSRVFSWYASRNDDFRSPIVRGMGRVKPRERARNRVLTDEEIRDVWAGLDAAGDVPACYPAFVRTLLLTAVRRTEAARMAWSEVEYLRCDDFAGEAWTIPGSRMKGKLDHVVPLTPVMLGIAGNRPNDAHRRPFVFSTTDGKRPFSGFSKAKKALDRALAELRKADGREPMPRWTLHDLRRTAKTLMARAGVRPDISERVLSHVIPGVEGIYDRHGYLPEKRDALERLASLIERILNPVTNVVVLQTVAVG